MGTFIIRPTILSNGGSVYVNDVNNLPAIYTGWYNAAQPTDNYTILQIIKSSVSANKGPLVAVISNSPNPTTFNDTIRFWFYGDCIYLDGSPTPISMFDLPAGFIALTATLSLYPDGITTPPSVGSSQFFLQLDTFTEGSSNVSSLSYNSPQIALNLLNNGCGIRVAIDILDINDFGDVEIQELVMEGTYTIIQNSFTLENPTVPVRVGDKVKFSISNVDESIPPPPPDINDPSTWTLDGVDRIGFYWINPVTLIYEPLYWIDIGSINSGGPNPYYIITQTQYAFIFYLPLELGDYEGPILIKFVGNEKQFFGTVDAGTLQVLYEDASGIYELVKDQTSDILYFRDGYITDIKLLMLPSMIYNNELYEEDFFNSMQYPIQVLAENELDESLVQEEEQEDYSMISTLRIPIVTRSVEIPSPFVRTAFLP